MAPKPSNLLNKKSFNDKLVEEYKPPFPLNYKWTPSERIKLKLPNPYVEGQFETFNFPVCATETKFADRALFYKEFLDLQEQAELGDDNVLYLYHMFKRCLKDQALVDWIDITENRPRDQRTVATYAEDIDSFIKYHESRDNEDLIQAQVSYMSKVHKPIKATPSEFRNQLLRLNNLILAIPDAIVDDQFSNLKIKYLFVESMPANWRREFRKLGKKVRSEELDELAHFFDMQHEHDPPTQHGNSSDHKVSKSNQSHGGSGGNKQSNGVKIRPNDPCPLHGGTHTWNMCFDNKNGPHFRPPSSNRSNVHHDNHYQDEIDDNPDENPDDDPNSESESEAEEYEDDNPYDDDYNVESDSHSDKEPELVPMTFAETKQQNQTFHLSKVLADSGGTRSSIARSSIPNGCKICRKEKPFSAITSAGAMDHFEFVHFDKLFLPEFSRSRWIEDVEFVVFDDNGHSAYNAILGRDILEKAGIDVKFSSKEVTWDEHTIPFHPRLQPICPSKPDDPLSVLNVFEDSFASSESLKPSDYNVKTTGKDIAEQQTHLIPQHRTALAAMLAKHDEMFNRVLGKYPDGTVRLQIVPGVSPIHCKPFAVPHRNLKQFKREIDTLVLLDVIEPILISEWAFPSFLVPKKDGTARFVSDFRRLNEILPDEKHDLPKIRDVLQRRSGFDFVTTIDITSQFYHFSLDPESRRYVVITTPFGKYRYKRLPMGIKIAPSYAQAVMTKLFRDLMDFVECFMDDLAIFTKGTFEQHLKDVDLVLSRLNAANFSIKAKKCHFAVQRVEYLGHIITPQGIEPQPQKVSSILQIASPKTPKQLRQFIGMVNYYRDHIPCRSHLLAPLTAQTKHKKHLDWTPECEKSFQAIKSKLAQDCMLSYPDPNFPFVIEPDSSDYQLGAIILQNIKDKLSIKDIITLFTSKPDVLPPNFKPIAYFSRKLSSAQRNYTTLEKELLSFVETLLEYRSILLGCPIIIFTDHRNLTFNGPTTTQSQRALRWRLVIEEYNVTIVHRAGASNFAADALSRLPLLEPEEPSSVRQAQERFDDSYLFYPVQDRMQAPCPVTLANIQAIQNADAQLQQMVNRNTRNYRRVDFGDTTLIQFRQSSSGPWRIVLPMALIPSALRWFHQLLMHPGATRMLLTINKHFTFPRMRSVIEDFVGKCDICQRTKLTTPRDGLLPLKDPELDPWYQVQVDLIGPWEVDLGPARNEVVDPSRQCY
jgi:Reverse transcriptase (RNA-dependent DNA polymerase).